MADLEREKRRLQKERQQIEEDGIISFDEIVSAVGSTTALGGKLPLILSIASRVAPLAGTFAGPLVNVVQSWLAARASNKVEEANYEAEESKNGSSKIKGTLLSLGKEVLGSYLKWKAMELSYKGISLIVKKRKAKKERKKNQ